VLSDHFEKVTILERDPVHDMPESRKGQAQTRHLHALLAQGLLIFREYFPGIQEELVAGGAVAGDMGERMHWYQYGGYRLQFTTGLVNISMSRPFLELCVRRRVLSLPNVTLADSCAVTELVTNAQKTRITGVHVNRRSGENAAEVLEADLVVDASGRGSATPKWLEGLGYARPQETEVKSNIGYSTREYRRAPKDANTIRIEMISPVAPHEKHGVFIFPIEDNRWIMTAGGYVGKHPPATEAELHEFVRSMPVSDVYDIISEAEPLTDIVTYRYAASLRHHYEKLSRFPEGFLVIGDAMASFNPIYGQGMTSAAVQTYALKNLLEKSTSLQVLWRPFFRQAAKAVDIPWQLTVGEDFRYPETVGKKPPFTDMINAYVVKIHRATQRDPVVYTQFLKVMNLMEPSTRLMSPGFMWRVFMNGRKTKMTYPGINEQNLIRKQDGHG
jgi:2-polyprenyl-6-methoxyphenol hydroxylase-like FAD-dependent oxidoreductase